MGVILLVNGISLNKTLKFEEFLLENSKKNSHSTY